MPKCLLVLFFGLFILRPDLFDDGLDGGFVEEGVGYGGVFVVGRRFGLLPELAAEEPGMDEASPERPAAERTFGHPDKGYDAFIPIGT